MVTSAHEGMHRIFQERPQILTPVFGLPGVPLSAKATVDAGTTDVTETRPLERRVDTVLRVEPSDGTDPETADHFFDFLEISLGNTPVGQRLKEVMSFVSYFPGRGTVRETAFPRRQGRR
ncbi:hypothetical protein [Streptomyces sp. NPDC058964]|uniref:hypothetical protein n=1 Tax=Streptomyces sp. NPDC058964 TaxID=3346681 RepID=UPI00369B0F52